MRKLTTEQQRKLYWLQTLNSVIEQYDLEIKDAIDTPYVGGDIDYTYSNVYYEIEQLLNY